MQRTCQIWKGVVWQVLECVVRKSMTETIPGGISVMIWLQLQKSHNFKSSISCHMYPIKSIPVKLYFKCATNAMHLLQYYLRTNWYKYLHWVVVMLCTNIWHCVIKPARSGGFWQIKKIPYQAPRIQLGPQKCTFLKNAF